MPVRQYIGARYVPKFFENPSGTAEWMPNVPYDSLTLVTYLGATYTSKKQVAPSNVTPNLDTTNWVLSSNYNAQVDQYRNDVERLNGSVDNLDAELTALTGTVTNQGTAISNFGKKSLLLDGDSYGAREEGWCNRVRASAIALGWTADIIAVSSAAAAGRDNTYLSHLENYTGDKTAITDIVLAAGANDYGIGADIMNSAIHDYVLYAQQNYPNARVHLGMIGVDTNKDYMMAYASNILPAFSNRTENNADYMANIEYVLHGDNLYDGTGHPTERGYALLASAIFGYLNGGAIDVNYRYNLSLISPTAAGNLADLTMFRHNSTCVIAGSIQRGAESSQNLGQLNPLLIVPCLNFYQLGRVGTGIENALCTITNGGFVVTSANFPRNEPVPFVYTVPNILV